LSRSSSAAIARARGILRDQTFDAERHVGEAAGGIQARTEHEAEIVGGGTGGVAPCDVEQRCNARLHAAGTNPLQALLHQHAIVAVEAYYVGDGAERNEVQQ